MDLFGPFHGPLKPSPLHTFHLHCPYRRYLASQLWRSLHATILVGTDYTPHFIQAGLRWIVIEKSFYLVPVRKDIEKIQEYHTFSGTPWWGGWFQKKSRRREAFVRHRFLAARCCLHSLRLIEIAPQFCSTTSLVAIQLKVSSKKSWRIRLPVGPKTSAES